MRSWVASVRTINKNYLDLFAFRSLIIRSGRPFVELWLELLQQQPNEQALREWVAVYECINSGENVDRGLCSKVLEHGVRQLGIVLRAGEVDAEELLYVIQSFRLIWLEAIPNLSRMFAETVGDKAVMIPTSAIDLVSFCVQRGMSVGGDWTGDEVQTFVDRAVQMSREACLAGIIRACTTQLDNQIPVSRDDIRPMWLGVSLWNQQRMWTLKTNEKMEEGEMMVDDTNTINDSDESLDFDTAVCMVIQKLDILDTLWLQQTASTLNDLSKRGIIGVLVWAAYCIGEIEPSITFISLELQRTVPDGLVQPLPPPVACIAPLNKLRLQDIVHCLQQTAGLCHVHRHLPDPWILSWIGYLILYIRLDGNLVNLRTSCSQAKEWSSILLDLTVDERTWRGALNIETDVHRAKVLLVALDFWDDVHTNMISTERAISWLVQQRWHFSPGRHLSAILNRVICSLRDEVLLEAETLRFFLQTKGLPALKRRLLNMAPGCFHDPLP